MVILDTRFLLAHSTSTLGFMRILIDQTIYVRDGTSFNQLLLGGWWFPKTTRLGSNGGLCPTCWREKDPMAAMAPYFFFSGCRMHQQKSRKVVSRIKTPEGFEAEEVQGSVKYFGSYIVVCAYELMFFLGILQQNMGHMGRKVMFWLSKCWSAGYCWATFASFRSWSYDSP